MVTRRAFLSALAAVPVLRYLEPLARWITPAPAFDPEFFYEFRTDWIPLTRYPGVVQPNALFTPALGEYTGIEFQKAGDAPLQLGYGPLGLDSKPPEWAQGQG